MGLRRTGRSTWRMTGSARSFTEAAERFILLLGEKKKERVWERKGRGIEPGGSLADFCFSVFFVFFSAPFLEAPFSVFFQFLGAFGGAWGGHFWTFFVNKMVFS